VLLRPHAEVPKQVAGSPYGHLWTIVPLLISMAEHPRVNTLVVEGEPPFTTGVCDVGAP